METVWVALGGGVVTVLALFAALRRGGSADAQASKEAHEQAQEREAPVELGETYEFGVTEFTDHHSGDRVAVGKVEGFALFTEEVPGHLSEGDVVRAKVLSCNRGRTSADATFVDTD